MADERLEASTGRIAVPAPPRPFDADEPPASDVDLRGSEDADGRDHSRIDESAAPGESEPFEDLSELPALLEALLFVADHPLDEGYLARALEVSTGRIRGALDGLAQSLREGRRGIRLQWGPEGAQLVSAPEAAPHVERFLGLEANRRLSTAALETLAIIAYRQPVTRGQVDAVRGVSSDGAIQTLRARGLVEPAGHAAGPGRPVLFRTTQRFLEHFGLERAGQLPPLPDDIELPAHEISEQLGLDQALVEQALAQAREPEPEDAAGDELEGAGADVDIPHEVHVLTAAAEQALGHGQAHPPMAHAGSPAPAPPAPPGDERPA